MRATIYMILVITALFCLGSSLAGAATIHSNVIAGTVSTAGAVTGGGKWTDVATWQEGTVPTSADDVIIVSGSLVYMDSAKTVHSVTIQSGGSMASGNGTNNFSFGSDITAPGTFTIEAGATFYQNRSSGNKWPQNFATYAIDPNSNYIVTTKASSSMFGSTPFEVGNMTVYKTGGVLVAFDTTYFNIKGTLTINTGAGAGLKLTNSKTTIVDVVNTIHIGGNVNIISGYLSAADNQQMTTIVNVDSNVIVGDASGATSSAILAGTSGVLTGKRIAVWNIAGNLSFVNGGILRPAMSTGTDNDAVTINLKGNLSTDSLADQANGTDNLVFNMNFVGTGTQTVTLGDTVKFASSAPLTLNDTIAATSHVVFNGGKTWASKTAGSVNGPGQWVVNGGLALGANDTLGGIQGFSLIGGATLTTANVNGVNGSIQVTGTQSFSPDANYGFDGSAAQVTGTVMPATVKNLTINSSSVVALTQATTINGILNLAAGVLDNTIPFTLGPNGSIVFGAGSLAIPLGIDLSRSTIDFGTVHSGQNKNDSVTVTNHGTITLNITVTSTNTKFSVTPTSASVSAGSTKTFYIMFAPTAEGSQSGKIVFSHNALSASDTVTVIGTGSAAVGVENVEAAVPKVYQLRNNYPNPFNPSTTIQYDIPQQSTVVLKVYSLLGQELATLVDGVVETGYHQIVWNSQYAGGKQVASGVYLFRMNAQPTSGKGEAFTQVKKMLLVK